MAAATQVKLFVTAMCDRGPLLHAPSIREWDYIQDKIDKVPMIDADLDAGPFDIVAQHRGYELHLNNKALIYRNNPRTSSAHGFTSMPSINDNEDVLVLHKEKWYKAEAFFL
jgi:hypothetical protein